MENKLCIKCNKEFPATKEYFRSNSKCKLGITLVCKSCDNERAKDYREKDLEKKRINGRKSYHKNKHKKTNKDRNKEYQKKYYQRNRDRLIKNTREWVLSNHDKVKDYLKTYRIEYDKKNAEKISKRKKEYRENNLELIQKKAKKWRQSNKEKCNIVKHNRRSRESNLVSSFDIYDWQRCLDYFNNECSYCGKNNKLQQDHFIAVRWGGEYTKDNIVTACKSCNSSKCDKNFFIWYPKQKFYSANREKKILKYLGYNSQTQTQQLTLVI